MREPLPRRTVGEKSGTASHFQQQEMVAVPIFRWAAIFETASHFQQQEMVAVPGFRWAVISSYLGTRTAGEKTGRLPK